MTSRINEPNNAPTLDLDKIMEYIRFRDEMPIIRIDFSIPESPPKTPPQQDNPKQKKPRNGGFGVV